MFPTVPVPQKGDRISAAWGAAVASGINALAPFAAAHGLVRQGVGNGTEPLPENRRNRKTAAEEKHPWKVYALTQSEDVDHCFEIYVPANALTLGGECPEIEGLSPVGDSSDRYRLDDESGIGSGATVFVVVARTATDSDDADGEEEEESDVTARVVVSDALPEAEDEEKIVAVFPVATVSIDDSGDDPVGKVESQYAKSVVALSEPGREPDGISTDTVTDEDADDPSAIQIKDFDNEASDGSQGLAQRLEIVKDGEGDDATYHIEAKENKSSVFLLARVNGKIKYIPLTGTKDTDEDEQNPETETDPCEHPGGSGDGEGGVVADDDDGEVHDGKGSDGGGVGADGETHPGNPCTTC